jgi:DNA-directed RNA polymerase specialized sigma24 family protein
VTRATRPIRAPRTVGGAPAGGAGLPPFDQLVTDHGAVVLRVRAVCGPIEAEDAWSVMFLPALAACPRRAPGGDPRGRLITIARRKAIDQHRRTARAPEPRAELPESPTGVGMPGDERRQQAADLWAAVATLPVKQRATVATLPTLETSQETR